MTSFVNLTYTFFLTSVLGMVDCTRSKGPKAQGLGRAEVLGGRVKNPGALAYSVTSRPHGLGLLCKIYTGVRKAHAGGGTMWICRKCQHRNYERGCLYCKSCLVFRWATVRVRIAPGSQSEERLPQKWHRFCEPMQEDGAHCDEWPECTHVLAAHEKAKAAAPSPQSGQPAQGPDLLKQIWALHRYRNLMAKKVRAATVWIHEDDLRKILADHGIKATGHSPMDEVQGSYKLEFPAASQPVASGHNSTTLVRCPHCNMAHEFILPAAPSPGANAEEVARKFATKWYSNESEDSLRKRLTDGLSEEIAAILESFRAETLEKATRVRVFGYKGSPIDGEKESVGLPGPFKQAIRSLGSDPNWLDRQIAEAREQGHADAVKLLRFHADGYFLPPHRDEKVGKELMDAADYVEAECNPLSPAAEVRTRRRGGCARP